jgi:hypothetical protein
MSLAAGVRPVAIQLPRALVSKRFDGLPPGRRAKGVMVNRAETLSVRVLSKRFDCSDVKPW